MPRKKLSVPTPAKAAKIPLAEVAEAPAAPSVPSGYEEVENIIPGSVITLHDGSQLPFKEKAAVPAALAAEMRERKQVK